MKAIKTFFGLESVYMRNARREVGVAKDVFKTVALSSPNQH